MVKKRYNVSTAERTSGYLKNFIIGITEFVLKYLLLHEFEGFACKNESLSRLLNTQIFFFDLIRPHKMIFVNIALFFALKII